MEFAERLRQLMDKNGTSNYELAKNIDTHQTSVANWLSGSMPQARKLKAIADYFNVSVEYLTGEAEEPEEIKKAPAFDVKTDTENKVSDLGSVALNIIHKLKPEFQEDALAYLLELSAKQRASEGKE